MRILIVEDEIKIRTGMSRLITSHTQHTVVGEAKNGAEGLELIERLRPELVISDIRMPVMDGLEMLKEVQKRGIRSHFVILSGYSEFEYAQKAIRYGVDDYLLKPLAPEDVTEILNRVQEKISEEETESGQTTEGLIRDILLGGKQEGSESCSRLEKTGAFVSGMPIYVAAGYIGGTGTKYCQGLRQQMEKLKEKHPELRIYYFMVENSREFFLFVQGETQEEELKKRLTRRLYQNVTPQDEPVWIFGSVREAAKLQKIAERRKDDYLYGMKLGYRHLLTEEEIQKIQTKEFQYPVQFETSLQTAICRETPERVRREAEAFQKYAGEMECAPKYIKKTYKKMLAFLEYVCHEVNADAYKLLQNQDLERAMSEQFTLGEFETCFRRAIDIIADAKDKKQDIRNYAIQRAISHIREHYRENISLEQLASRLELTPEYLSALFNREVGINFSTFLKRFRISQAKRLLKGTDQKIYEIAQQVGYNDPKYFNRVFKEEIGVSPGEYRQNS